MGRPKQSLGHPHVSHASKETRTSSGLFLNPLSQHPNLPNRSSKQGACKMAILYCETAVDYQHIPVALPVRFVDRRLERVVLAPSNTWPSSCHGHLQMQVACRRKHVTSAHAPWPSSGDRCWHHNLSVPPEYTTVAVSAVQDHPKAVPFVAARLHCMAGSNVAVDNTLGVMHEGLFNWYLRAQHVWGG